ncbi:hypothetical protein ABT880_001145 [Salmonella enterica subsp. enterica serovar Thompson]|nr:hypothetical protein [Salmonella enterica subsp. enterica serovar Newport]EDT1690141.1 hypothetical protein [Salmonella enterica subsp. enterica serovar Oslo]ELP3484158.1 hypothetical protein [Salmonella enterica]EDH9202585.1 hypothetical protein [Salmonella enterica subsp. enterica serovar Newport]EJO8772292.1 hypothetical protein [Salmonella enterica subsp. enterica serovar Newport]
MKSLKPVGLVMLLILAGCSRPGEKNVVLSPAVKPAETVPETVKVVRPPVSVSPVSGGKAPALGMCDQELRALKRVDARRYAQRRAQFDRLMSGASLYADIRTDVAGGTREAVDAMYRFRTMKLCAEISRDVLEALTGSGDGASAGRN